MPTARLVRFFGGEGTLRLCEEWTTESNHEYNAIRQQAQ